ADQFDALTPLINWVENGVAPDSLTARRPRNPENTKLLCPYPAVATYNGQGDANRAANFHCAVP
ncbi:MAG: tannase/feruloyl esterase family alpha/beta hydrolase, partial [Pseudohongiellaceae bacterium]